MTEVNETNEMWRAVHGDRQRRNDERKQAALDRRDEIAAWAQAHDVVLTIYILGEHWQFRLSSGVIVNWWPGTGRAHVDKRAGRPSNSQTARGWDSVRDKFIAPLLDLRQ